MTNTECWGQFVNIEIYNINSDIYNNANNRRRPIVKKKSTIYDKMSIYSLITGILSYVGYEIE